jgi:hypothetical protein
MQLHIVPQLSWRFIYAVVFALLRDALALLDLFYEGGHDLVKVAYYAEVAELEDRGVGVFVYSYDGAGGLHAHFVLYLA